jgi:hypothetical protein
MQPPFFICKKKGSQLCSLKPFLLMVRAWQDSNLRPTDYMILKNYTYDVMVL